jgi:release factor glutamine methyltransferase
MKNSKSLFPELIGRITLKESAEEIRAIAKRLLEAICGLSATEIMTGKPVTPAEEFKLHEAIARINRSEPLQYVINEAYFFGRKFHVDPAVLIPRPETEELISNLLQRVNASARELRIVDVATGSGCIAITLGLELRGAQTWGTDVSDAALKVARANAAALQSDAQFLRHDILSEMLPVTGVDVVVSNPPYIAESEITTMKANVSQYEPHIALFVPDNDALLFYRALTKRSVSALVPGGLLAVEINERFGSEVATLITDAGYDDVEVLKDLAGKDRFVMARKRS